MLHLNVIPGTSPQIQIDGPPGTYQIDSADSLSSTPTVWREHATVVTPPYLWTDPEGRTAAHRLYRAVLR